MAENLYLNTIIESLGLEGGPVAILAEPTVKITKSLYELWLSKPMLDGIPKRRDFKPAQMKAQLPYIYMIDVLDGGEDFQMRLFGTALVELIGADFTGAKLSDANASNGWRGKIYKEVYANAKPAFYHFDLGGGIKRVITENVLLPVRGSNDDYNILLCASQVVEQRYVDLD